MATQNDSLIQRRKAALAAKQRAAAVAPEVLADVIDENPDPVDIPDRPPTRAVATRTTALPVSGTRPADRSREIGRSDLIMPMLKLSQAMSKVNSADVVRQGNFYETATNANLGKRIVIVPVDMQMSRSRYDQDLGLLCRSFDMVQGDGDPGILCEGTEEEIIDLPEEERGCPLRLWGPRDPVSKKSAPPACTKAYNFPVLILDPEDPENGPMRRAILTFRKTAASVGKSIITMKSSSNYKWHDLMIELTVTEKSGPRGMYYVPQARFMGRTKGWVAEQAVEFASTYNPEMMRATVSAAGEDE